MNQNNTVNVSMLKEHAATSPKFKALWELYGKRERGRQDSTVPRARRVLKASGIDITTAELREFYGVAQRANAGRWNGRQARFIWGWHLKSIADNVNGHKYVIDPAKVKYRLEPKSGKQVVDRDTSGYLIEPLTAADILKAPPKDRVRLPRLPAVSADAVRPTPKPTIQAEQIITAKIMPHFMTVKRAGFEIELPVSLTEQERQDAAAFLTALDRAPQI